MLAAPGSLPPPLLTKWAGEQLLLHVWPSGYSPLLFPPTPPYGRYSYRPKTQASPHFPSDSPLPAPPLSFRWWKRLSDKQQAAASSSLAGSLTYGPTSTATSTAGATASSTATPLIKVEIDDPLSPKVCPALWCLCSSVDCRYCFGVPADCEQHFCESEFSICERSR